MKPQAAGEDLFGWIYISSLGQIPGLAATIHSGKHCSWALHLSWHGSFITLVQSDAAPYLPVKPTLIKWRFSACRLECYWLLALIALILEVFRTDGSERIRVKRQSFIPVANNKKLH